MRVDDNDSCLAPGVVTLPTPETTLTDDVGATFPFDLLDCWRFVLSTTSDVEISLTGLSADLNMNLFDGSTTLEESVNSGTGEEFISVEDLAPGTYYIQVFPSGGIQSSYKLQFSASVNISDGNDTCSDKGVVRLPTPGGVGDGSVGGADPLDCWRIRLVSSQRTVFFDINISLRDLVANLDLFLFADGAAVPVASSTSPGTNDEEITMRGLTPGVFNIEIRPILNALSDYTLEFQSVVGGAALSNISYNGFVDEIVKPAFIQIATADVVVTAETLGLPNPKVSLRNNEDGSLLATNDTCDVADMSALIGRPLATPAEDACIVQTLEPGAYFIELSDVHGGSGNALLSATQIIVQ